MNRLSSPHQSQTRASASAERETWNAQLTIWKAVDVQSLYIGATTDLFSRLVFPQRQHSVRVQIEAVPVALAFVELFPTWQKRWRESSSRNAGRGRRRKQEQIEVVACCSMRTRITGGGPSKGGPAASVVTSW